LTPAVAQKKDLPSFRFMLFRGPDFELRYPNNWIIAKTGDTTSLSPEDGNVDATLAYGLLADIFEPRPRNSGAEIPAGGVTAESTISDAMDQLIEELKRTRPNLHRLASIQREVGGLTAIEMKLSNTSPVGGVELDRLIAVRRPNGTVRYFLAVTPQTEENLYNPIFNKVIESIRFYN